MGQERIRQGLFRAVERCYRWQHRPDRRPDRGSAHLGSDGARGVLMMGILAMALAAPGSFTRAAEDSGLKLSGSIRIRQEWLDGQYRPGFDNRDDALMMRSNLLAEWTHGAWK